MNNEKVYFLLSFSIAFLWLYTSIYTCQTISVTMQNNSVKAGLVYVSCQDIHIHMHVTNCFQNKFSVWIYWHADVNIWLARCKIIVLRWEIIMLQWSLFKLTYKYLLDNYVHIQFICVSMQHNYVENCKNMLNIDLNKICNVKYSC